MYCSARATSIPPKGTVGVATSQHWKLTADYQMGTIHGTADQMGFRLTQKGPVVGIEGSW
jgi:hypothetical protein